ncbi:unnamed protein product [Microthlaspi erraticum]|uniref:Uncharacterized protein n=1 Tax=Microthlaspi erraticum TaxID=1685480 RepID=A0A6D2HPV9_9BRAS|nr:unnamed protein product [Microthlaspi erraticum]
MEVMEITGKYPLRAPTTLALEMKFIGVGWISLGNDPMPPRCMRTRSSQSTEDLVELDSITGKSRVQRTQKVFWSIWSIWDVGARKDLVHGRSSTGYAKEEGGSHLEDQLDHLLDHPVEFLNSTGQASTRSSWKSKSNPKNVASPLTFL